MPAVLCGVTLNGSGAPMGIRTPVLTLKGSRPGPLDDGDGTRVAQLYTPYLNGQPQTDVITTYFMGGAYEVTGTAVKKYYSIAGMTVAMNDGTGLQYLLTDHLGSVVVITDNTGTLISQQRYLPFGQVRSDLNGPRITQTDFAFTGQRALDMGLSDFRARMFDPLLQRFIQPDTIIPSSSSPQSWNRYAYTLNDPINGVDPSGHITCRDDDEVCLKKIGQLPVIGSSGSSGGGSQGSSGGSSSGSGNKENDELNAYVGNFQLLPTSSYYLTYSQIAQEGYGGWWMSGAPAYGDVLLPGFPANSRQVGVGAAGSAPAVILDLYNIAAPYIQKAVYPYTQSVSVNYSTQFYNIPRTDAYKVSTVNGLVITNSSGLAVDYAVAISSNQSPDTLYTNTFTVAPGKTASAPLPGKISTTGNFNISISASTGCMRPCIVGYPLPPLLAGFANFIFNP